MGHKYYIKIIVKRKVWIKVEYRLFEIIFSCHPYKRLESIRTIIYYSLQDQVQKLFLMSGLFFKKKKTHILKDLGR